MWKFIQEWKMMVLMSHQIILLGWLSYYIKISSSESSRWRVPYVKNYMKNAQVGKQILHASNSRLYGVAKFLHMTYIWNVERYITYFKIVNFAITFDVLLVPREFPSPKQFSLDNSQLSIKIDHIVRPFKFLCEKHAWFFDFKDTLQF